MDSFHEHFHLCSLTLSFGFLSPAITAEAGRWTLPSYCPPSDYVSSRKSHKCTAYMLCIPFVRFLLFPFHLQKSHNFYHITLRAKWWKIYMGLPVYLDKKSDKHSKYFLTIKLCTKYGYRPIVSIIS